MNGDDLKAERSNGKRQWAAVAMAAVFGAGSGTGVQLISPFARSDPFTGTEGRVLDERLDRLERWKESHDRWALEQSQEWVELVRNLIREHERDEHHRRD